MIVLEYRRGDTELGARKVVLLVVNRKALGVVRLPRGLAFFASADAVLDARAACKFCFT